MRNDACRIQRQAELEVVRDAVAVVILVAVGTAVTIAVANARIQADGRLEYIRQPVAILILTDAPGGQELRELRRRDTETRETTSVVGAPERQGEGSGLECAVDRGDGGFIATGPLVRGGQSRQRGRNERFGTWKSWNLA